jgi:hypothetical protein
MSDVRTSLATLVDVLSSAVAPDSVGLQDGGPIPTDPVVVQVLTVERIGRSRRDGPVLDLELSAAVRCTGPRSLENVEQLLGAIESGAHYAVGPLAPSVGEDRLGFLVRIPVTMRLPEPEGPPVREPVVVNALVGRHLYGVVVGPDGFGIAGASVRSLASSVEVQSDGKGRFEMLSTPDPVQEFSVGFRGATRQITVDADPLPVIIRWE